MAKGPEIATNLMFVPKCLEQEVITGNDIIFNSFLYYLPTLLHSPRVLLNLVWSNSQFFLSCKA